MSQESVYEAVGFQVKRVQQGFRRHSDAALAPLDLSMAQYAVLQALDEQPGASAADVSRTCFVTRQTLQDLIRTLRERELVDVAAAPIAGRSLPLRLLPPGRRMLRRARTIVLGVEEQMLAGVPAGERERLLRLLRRCGDNLEA